MNEPVNTIQDCRHSSLCSTYIMRVNTFTLGAVLGLLAVGGTIAARVPYHAFQDVLISEDAVSGLKGTAQSLLHLTRRREEKEEGIAAIRFFVPPSEGDDFEEAWLKLEQDVRDEEKHNDIFDLKKSKLDNLIYYSYGEWEQLRDLHEHFHTDHFQDFAEYVDDHGIAWELRLLTSESRDLDEEQRKGSRRANLERKGGQQPEQPEQPDQDDWEKYVPEEYRPDRDSSSKKKKGRKHKHELSRAVLSTLPADVSDEEAMRVWHELSAKKDLAHVLFHYFVPPGEADKFTDSWLDAAEKTIDEPGNRIFSLRKIATDNTRFYGYGTWDSYGDFMDHFHSRHVERLRGDLDDSDVVYFIQPLIKIGKQKE